SLPRGGRRMANSRQLGRNQRLYSQHIAVIHKNSGRRRKQRLVGALIHWGRAFDALAARQNNRWLAETLKLDATSRSGGGEHGLRRSYRRRTVLNRDLQQILLLAYAKHQRFNHLFCVSAEGVLH